MRYLLFVLLLILPVFAGAQTRVYVTQDQPQQIRQFRGGVDALNYFRLPIQGGHSIPAGDSLWFVRVNPGDGQIYMYNGLTWSCMTCGGTGIVDSSVFVTVTRLRDSLLRVQQTLNDSTAALRMAISGGSADSLVFATLYRLDTTRAGLDMRIALKQNQLNGTGFVKASGTTISYDNSTYTPTGRTITINGSTQDLSANRTWTIPGVDTTSLSNRIDGKLSTTDTSTMLGGYLRKGDTASLSNRINSKQNTITLSTTGTSGAATFNQSTGALNIPNYANTTYTGSTSIILNGTSFQRAALTGDVTATQNSNSTTISNSAVTNAKMANMTTQTFKGRNTAGSGAPEDLSVSTVRSMLSINNVDNTSDLNKPISTATQNALDLKIDSVKTSVDSIYVKSNGTWYFAGVISAQGAGVSWGSIGGTLSSQTDLQNALDAKLNIGDSTIYFSVSRALDSLSDHWLAIEGKLSSSDGRIANWTAAYNDKVNSAAFSGTTTKTLTLTQQDGGTVTASFTDDNTTYTGSTSISLTGGSFQRAALTGDVTSPANSNSTTIANNAVTNAKADDMAVNTIKGRITSGTGDPQDLTASQVRTIINVADGAEVNVNADWNASSGDAQILNKPTIPSIAGLATQAALDDSMSIARDSILALRAGIESINLSDQYNLKIKPTYDSTGQSGHVTIDSGILKVNGAFTFMHESGGRTTLMNNRWASPAFNNISDSSARPKFQILSSRYNSSSIGSQSFTFVGADSNYVDPGMFVQGVATNVQMDKNYLNWPEGLHSTIQLSAVGFGAATADSIVGSVPKLTGYYGTVRSGNVVIDRSTGFEWTYDANGIYNKTVGSIMTMDQGIHARTGYWNRANDTNPWPNGFWSYINTVPGRPGWFAGGLILSNKYVDTGIFHQNFADRTHLILDSTLITMPHFAGSGVKSLVVKDNGEVDTATVSSGGGTVTSVGVSVPTGFSVSGSPVTSSGTVTISYAAGYQGYTSTEASKLTGIEAGADVTDATNVAAAGAIMDGDFSANGVMIRTGSGSYTSRTITGTTNQITVTNGNGVSGNPTISLPSAVTNSLGLANTALQFADTNVIATKHYVDSSLNTPALVSINNQSGSSYTLTSNDFNGKTVVVAANSGSITIEVPPSMPVGSSVLVEQGGAGQITFTPGSGVSLHSFESALTTKGTNATVTIYCKAADTYTLTGNLE